MRSLPKLQGMRAANRLPTFSAVTPLPLPLPLLPLALVHTSSSRSRGFHTIMTPTPAVPPPPPEVDALKAILLRTGKASLTPADLKILLSSLSGPSEAHSLSLAILSRFLNPDPSSTTLSSLRTALESRLSGTDSTELIQGLKGLSAVLQVAPPVAATLLKDEALRLRLEEAVEHISRPVGGTAGGKKGKGRQEEEVEALVELLSLAAGQPGMRALVRKTAGGWLEGLLGEVGKVTSVEEDESSMQARVRALAGVGVVKLRLGKEEPSTTGLPMPSEPEEKTAWTLEELAKLFVRLVVDGAKRSGGVDEGVLLPSLEGLAYLTLTSSTPIKTLVTSPSFLSAIFSFAPKTPTPPTSSTAARDYAIATLLDHLTAFPPPLDAESDAAQLARLKKFAAAAAKKGEPAPSALGRESVESVSARISKLVKNDPSPIPTIRQLCMSPSLQTRRLAAKILHSLVTPQPLRGAVLQSGAARFFLTLIRQLPTPFSPADDTPAVQGLAKLLITANPLLVLGPTASSPLLLEATTALTLPLGAAASASESVGLLPRFESMMALTNIASLDPSLTDQLARLTLRDRPNTLLLAAVEELLLSANTMMRRAATELGCNLVASDPGIEYFEPPSSSSISSDDSKPPSSKLHLLLALCSSPDLPTRTAATGALTSLVYSPSISLSLLSFPKWVAMLLLPLEDEDEGVRHRAGECWRVAGGLVAQVSEGEGDKRETARRTVKEGRVVEKLREREGKEKVVELKEVFKAAREAVEQV